MKLQYTLIGLFAVVLLVVPPFGLVLSDNELNGENTDAGPTSTLKNDIISSTTDMDLDSVAIKTTIPISATTTTNNQINTSVTAAPISTTSSTTNTTSTSVEVSTVSLTVIPPTASSTTSITTTTEPVTTTSPSGRKFDGLSFLGGMILVVGLGGLVFLVIRYLRRTNRLPYSNLR